MIIAVNISKALAEGKPKLEATRRAWQLDLNKCREHDFVIGVDQGQIKSFFILIEAFSDTEEENRVAFHLKECTERTKQMIKDYIKTNDINLGGVQKGKYI